MDAMNLTWTNETRRLRDLVDWERNPRNIKQADAARLERSLSEFGQVQTIAIEPDGTLVDGHQRTHVWAAAQHYGPDYEVDVRVASRKLTEQERQALVIALHGGASGSWDWDALASFDFATVSDWGFDADLLREWNDDAANLALMLEAEEDEEAPEDPGAQVDRAEELREKWGVEAGQLWQLGDHRLICGDCTDPDVVVRAMGGEKADACISDPPYGMNWSADASRFSGGKFGNHPRGRERDDVINDDKPFDPAPYMDYPVVVLWGMNHYCDKLQAGGALVWIKKPDERFGTFLSDCEIAWTNVGHGVYAIRHEWGGITRESERGEFWHPTQKPVVVVEWTIEKTKAGRIIYDPFVGSGTTLVACERLGRKCRAVEIEPKYCAVALQRWTEMTGKTPERVE